MTLINHLRGVAGALLFATTVLLAQAQAGVSTLHTFTGTNSRSFPYASVIVSGGTLYGVTYGGGTGNAGTLYKINIDGSGFAVLYNFNGLRSQRDGVRPYGGLVLSGSTLYGTTSEGGGTNAGTIFKINTDGSGFSVLYQFTGGADGATPKSNLILSSGTLYGTSYAGGNFSAGTVFKINTDGTGFTSLYSFTASSDGANPEGNLALSSGVLYGTTSDLEAGVNGTVFKINTDGSAFATLYAFTGGADGANPVGGVTLSSGTLYGTTSDIMTETAGTVFKINTDGTGFTTLYDFANANDGFTPQSPLKISGSTLYGTTSAGGANGTGVVFKLSTSGTGYANLRSFSALPPGGSTNSDGTAPYAGLALSSGTLYGTATEGGKNNSGSIYKVNTDGSSFSNLHNFLGGDDGATPTGGLVLSGSALYGTNGAGGSYGQGTVFKVGLDGKSFTTLHSFNGSSDGNLPLVGLALSGSTLYGTTQEGGSKGGGTLFKISTDGSGFAVLYSFSTVNGGGWSPSGKIAVSNGMIYGTTLDGGSGDTGVIYKIKTDGSSFSTLHNFPKSGGAPVGVIVSGSTICGTTNEGGDSDFGSVYKIKTDGTGFTTLHSFNGVDGAYLRACVVLSGTTLYGVTYDAPAAGQGSVYKVNTDGTGFVTLHKFAGSEAAYPVGELILSGNVLYGTGQAGGANDRGMIFQINTDGTGLTSLYDFTAGSDGGFPFAPVLLSNNVLYGVAAYFGTGDSGTVFSLNLP